MTLQVPLSEAVVVVTGASSGVGALTALGLATRGARLVLAARGRPALDDVADKCQRLGADVMAVPTDMTDVDEVERLAAAAETRFGRIDGWVNNAAVATYGDLADMPLEDIRRTIDVDLFGYLYGARAALPRLRAAGGGVVVMVGSVLSEVSFPYLGPYIIAKHAVSGLCATLRQELRVKDIPVSVCAVLPGTLDTPFYDHAGNRTGRALRPPPPVNGPDRVAARIARLLESPRRQVYVGTGMRALAWQMRIAPGLTERVLTWYAQRATFARGTAPVTTGNLYASGGTDRAHLDGGWRAGRSRSAALAATAAGFTVAGLVARRRAGR